ncbi:aminotransferase class V-fold PLP-dependent enzyme [Phaeacidiphilus oryzae]|uniref:aminotransferase class V-fold PLP-dependent enzyme n=1 Tax=Phaeacidiphilus oryzae TaxID=348818 RepID=UPI00055DF545|nr:aminotransferase class V-fold PLP-dependent enzyme [Phaeacidiphilus oryzae]
MDLHDQYGLTRVVNARGPFTPLGVSRTDPEVAAATAEALGGFFVMDELQALASRELAAATGAEAGTVVHCTASAITLAVAASMAGESPERVAALPDTAGMPARAVLPAGHAVDYGQPIVQAVRLSGATAVLAGSGTECTAEDLARALDHPGTACLLLVSSRLTRGAVPFADAVAAAHRLGVPVVVDGAAQVLRVRELLATGADLVLVSGQKYLGAPTAGLVLGRAGLIAAVRAQEKGIGRGMKATKEAILGVLAALRLSREGSADDPGAWRKQAERVARFAQRAAELPGIEAAAAPDPTGLPFPRVGLRVDASRAGMDAKALAAALRSGSPQIWVIDQDADRGRLLLELVPLTDAEVELVLARLALLIAG